MTFPVPVRITYNQFPAAQYRDIISWHVICAANTVSVIKYAREQPRSPAIVTMK